VNETQTNKSKIYSLKTNNSS